MRSRFIFALLWLLAAPLYAQGVQGAKPTNEQLQMAVRARFTCFTTEYAIMTRLYVEDDVIIWRLDRGARVPIAVLLETGWPQSNLDRFAMLLPNCTQAGDLV